MDPSPAIAREGRGATPVATLRRFAHARRAHGLATWDRALEQLLPALEPTEATV